MTFLQLLNPFAPHMTEELWKTYGGEGLLAYAAWPTYDEAKTVEDEITLPVQVNGKLRANIDIVKDEDKESIRAKIFANEK